MVYDALKQGMFGLNGLGGSPHISVRVIGFALPNRSIDGMARNEEKQRSELNVILPIC